MRVVTEYDCVVVLECRAGLKIPLYDNAVYLDITLVVL
jgi:hypothetical protein